MLTRKASAPASASLRIMSRDALAGPSVARMRTLRLRGTNLLGRVSLVAMGGRIVTPAASSTRREQECLSTARPPTKQAAIRRIRIARSNRRFSRSGPTPGWIERRSGYSFPDRWRLMAEGNVAADELRLLIERIERLEEEKKAIADDVKDVYAEAKARGYDTKTMRTIVRLRKMESQARQEADALLETYRAALGLD